MTAKTPILQLIPPTHPLLNTRADVVTTDELGSAYIQGVITRMLELSAGKGHSKHDSRQMVGLAAVQLGVPKRIITIDLTADGSQKAQSLQVIINPMLVQTSGSAIQGREGCWSCGNICGNVERAPSVVLKGQDRNGVAMTLILHDFVARIAQHENDHLEGIRFPDRIPTQHPERLHWVAPDEFGEYRRHWAQWSQLCPRERWEKLKTGVLH